MSPTEPWVRKVLGRPEAPGVNYSTLPHLGKVLVTGGEGSIGVALKDILTPKTMFIGGQNMGEIPTPARDVLYTDIRTMDVRDERNVMAQFLRFEPDLVIHLAASKHAPYGEEDPYEVYRTNVEGTRHVLEWCDRIGATCVVASTCKACDPETAYGASKLVAERMALNAGQRVARFYNVVETSGNVFEIWRRIEHEAMPYTVANRRFTSLYEAIGLTLWVAAHGDSERYTLTNTVSRPMRDVLADVYPNRENFYYQRPLRRGDRVEEPRHAACERMEEVPQYEWISRVRNPHDPPNRKESE